MELKLSKIDLLEQVKENAFNIIKLKVKLNNVNDELIGKLEVLLNARAGKSSVEFYVEDEEQHLNVKLFSKKNKVAVDNEFLFELDKMTDIKYDLA